MKVNQVMTQSCPRCHAAFRHTFGDIDGAAELDRHTSMLICHECAALLVVDGDRLIEAEPSDLREMREAVPDLFAAMTALVLVRRKKLAYEAACDRHERN
jgi:hypothetical protein